MTFLKVLCCLKRSLGTLIVSLQMIVILLFTKYLLECVRKGLFIEGAWLITYACPHVCPPYFQLLWLDCDPAK